MTEQVSLLIDIGEQSAIPASVWADLLAERRGMGLGAVASHIILLRSSPQATPRTAGCLMPFPLL